MAGKEAPEVLAGLTLGKIMSEQALDRVWNFCGQAAISGGAGRRLMQAERAAYAEVVGVEQAVVHLDFFALNPEVGDPVLAATIGASRDVQLEVLVESGKALIQLLDQPSRERLRFGDGELAELGAAARDCSSREGRTADLQSDVIQLFCKRLGIERRDVHHQHVLHVGRAEFAAGKTLSQIRGCLHLVRIDSAAQRNRTDITQPGLLLGVNSDVIAIDVVRRMFFRSGIESEADAILQFGEKAFGGPSVAQEEEFEASALAMLAQNLGIAEELGDALDHRHDLIPANERVEAGAEI